MFIMAEVAKETKGDAVRGGQKVKDQAGVFSQRARAGNQSYTVL